MKRILIRLFALATAVAAQSAEWVAGRHYTVIPTQRTSVPAGKVEVLEVFSYGCPACYSYQSTMARIKAGIPKNAQVAYLPASWHAEENWPVYQLAYLTAQALGVADKAHDAMFEAVWRTDELGVIDRSTGRPKRKLPTMEDVARFYERTTGVKAADFVKATKSFGVDLKARQADKQIVDMKIAGTPTIVVAGKYRIENDAIRGLDIVELVNFLVAKETAAKSAAAAPAAKKP